MKQVKVSLIGSEGYIGKKMYAHLKTEYDVTCIDLCTDIALDLKQPECFDYEVIENNYVIVMAAISSPDVCAKKYEEAYSINVKGTSYFIREAIKHGCRVLFFSSDAVFGFQNESVNELTETREDTAYGMMKKKIEDEFKDNPCFKAIRLSYVFSKTDRYTSYLLKCINEGKTAEVFHPFYRNVVTADDVITVVQWLINNWDNYKPSFLNVCGRELVSRVRIADEIQRYLGAKLEYTISYPGDSFYENRPSILEMKSLYINQVLSDESFSQKVQKQFII